MICYEYEQLAGKDKPSCQTNSEDEDVFWLFRVLWLHIMLAILEWTSEEKSWQSGATWSSTMKWQNIEYNQRQGENNQNYIHSQKSICQ